MRETSFKNLTDIFDYVINKANRWEIYFLWRPQLNDPTDDMVLELAVTANCNYILTYNVNNFKGMDDFGIEIMTPKEFLEMIGEL